MTKLTVKEILQDEKVWRSAFAKYPFDMSAEFVIFKAMNKYAKQEHLKTRSAKIELLESYSLFLEKAGYMDIDWKTEPPFAIDEFLTKNN